LTALVFSVIFFYFTDMVSANIENREMNIIISLSIGLSILVVDQRQDRHINEIIHTQHKMTHEIHKMIQEQMSLIRDMHKGSG
jgi:TolB-like protein